MPKDSGGKQLVVIFTGDVCNLHTFQSMIHDVLMIFLLWESVG